MGIASRLQLTSRPPVLRKRASTDHQNDTGNDPYPQRKNRVALWAGSLAKNNLVHDASRHERKECGQQQSVVIGGFNEVGMTFDLALPDRYIGSDHQYKRDERKYMDGTPDAPGAQFMNEKRGSQGRQHGNKPYTSIPAMGRCALAPPQNQGSQKKRKNCHPGMYLDDARSRIKWGKTHIIEIARCTYFNNTGVSLAATVVEYLVYVSLERILKRQWF